MEHEQENIHESPTRLSDRDVSNLAVIMDELAHWDFEDRLEKQTLDCGSSANSGKPQSGFCDVQDQSS